MNQPQAAIDIGARFGQWAVITGASSGIGRELAMGLAGLGLNVALASRNQPLLEELARLIEVRHKVETMVLPVDLGLPGAAQTLSSALEGHDVGLLVNSAGYGIGGPFQASDFAEESAMVDVNCRATLELTHLFTRRFVAQRRGAIILLSSIVAFQGVANSANYAATKAYVQSLGEGLAQELKPSGVTVLTAIPGPTASGFAQRARMKLARADSAQAVAEDIVVALLKGRSRVVPGTLGKLLLYSLLTAPRSLRILIMRTLMKLMTN